MNDRVVRVWSAILLAVPNAQLMLKSKSLAQNRMREQTQTRFAEHGVSAERLILLGAQESRDQHLAVYNSVDIALDTFPYPGVTTSVEALWMGVPVLSMRGNNFMSATATTIAKNSGLEEWIAQEDADYVKKLLDSHLT